MPYQQRKGYGKFLITFSYELSKIEGKVGTPERPLSDLGFCGYFTWWAAEIVKVLQANQGQSLSISDITNITYIRQADVIDVLERLNLLRYSSGNHIIYANPEYLEKIRKSTGRPGIDVKLENLHWTPYRDNH